MFEVKKDKKKVSKVSLEDENSEETIRPKVHYSEQRMFSRILLRSYNFFCFFSLRSKNSLKSCRKNGC